MYLPDRCLKSFKLLRSNDSVPPWWPSPCPTDPRPPRPALQLEDLKQFRQLDSVTPGHPENFMTKGIEVTTGK